MSCARPASQSSAVSGAEFTADNLRLEGSSNGTAEASLSAPCGAVVRVRVALLTEGSFVSDNLSDIGPRTRAIDVDILESHGTKLVIDLQRSAA